MPRRYPWVRYTIASFAIASACLVGCSRQAEGERCSANNDDNDCEGGLICVSAVDLRSDDGVSRCCPPATQSVSDSRCRRRDGSGTGAGGTGAGGTGSGEAGEAGAPTAGSGGAP